MRIGIVGNGSDKFTSLGQARARQLIMEILTYQDTHFMVSGHSPVGGIDIWAEEEATNLGIALDLKIPEVNQWNPRFGYGYKARNLDIAKDSDELHVIVADQYPKEYTGMKFMYCYHCHTPAYDHIKSGGCWTGKQAEKMGKKVEWWIVSNY